MRKITYASLLVAFICVFTACKDDDVISPITPAETTSDVTTTSSYSSINNWAYGVMQDAYYWSAELTAISNLDLSLDPFDFFEKLIYNRETIDRFSGLTDDYEALQNDFDGISEIFGIRYTTAYLDNSSTNLGLFLSQVTVGSAAEAAGMKRGDVIISIDNQSITASNFASLFSSSDTHTFSFGKLENDTWLTESSLTVTRMVTEENPVAYSGIIELPVSGKKLGYLLYTQFIPGSSDEYDNQLRSIFGEFKSNQVSELVLDFRFNGGGYISSAEVLSSLIGINTSSNDIFYKEKWNESYESYLRSRYGSSYFDHTFLDEANNIGNQLSRVFVLTSNSTASASELVINGLTPYMEVITIGENTYGKNLFGTLVGDDENNSNYGIYVMLGETTNALDQSGYGTVDGITPDYYVEDNLIPYLPIGDYNETLFSQVLEVLGEKTLASARLSNKKTIWRKNKFYAKEEQVQPMAKTIITLPKAGE
ncbi:S41 family peptidase [Arcticibacterium luteifluviistationis]|uniref:Peptidase S41 n=1 Tax=Arcticibacterium luteifluviistationis TaxID=1784714 RepID=A0A2Z4GG45_9BACT|nr:S41 family peptidase [Arcticibacterium luteifluviistationis]AWW00373.1 peptidase S41 [Arcticibacterium luteifluviistationis]